MTLEKNKMYYMVLLSKTHPSQIIAKQITIIEHQCPTSPIQRLTYRTNDAKIQHYLTIRRNTQNEINKIIKQMHVFPITIKGWFITDSKTAAAKEIRKYYKDYWWMSKDLFAIYTEYTLKTMYKIALNKIYEL